MKDLETVFERVSAWNKARYPRVYDKALSVSLLDEELEEYFEASQDIDQMAERKTGLVDFTRAVERLDALCDVIYVAMGVMWKLDINSRERTAHWMKACNYTNELINSGKPLRPPIGYAVGILSLHKQEVMYNVTIDMQMIIASCMAQMQLFGMTEEEIIDSLLVVCDSNDSKSVKKTDPTVKANIDKGQAFIAPKFRLQLILDEVAQRVN